MAEYSSGNIHYYELDSKSSSDEETTDRTSDQNDDTGFGGSGGAGGGGGGSRSYECVFCKRGFTTAQALGGHMNIHRKDRAPKTTLLRPNNSANHDQYPLVSSKLAADHHQNCNYTSLRSSFLSIQSFARAAAPADLVNINVINNYQTYNHNNNINNINRQAAASTCWGNSNYNTGNIRSGVPEVLDLCSSKDYSNNILGSTLSLGIGTTSYHEENQEEEEDDHYEHNKEKIISGGDHSEDVEVDLELRLGYDP